MPQPAAGRFVLAVFKESQAVKVIEQKFREKAHMQAVDKSPDFQAKNVRFLASIV
jgi:hypothetical protein